MGYTHYWRREKDIAPGTYLKIVMDFQKLLPVFEANGIKLRGGTGDGEPEFSEMRVLFNGDAHCGHEQYDLGIAWPAARATGVSVAPVVVDEWFAGAKIEQRSCDGDCSHEAVDFPLRFEPQSWQEPEDGKYFEFCKTAFKPYDWAVTAFLVIAKHYLGDKIVVSSDGELEHWYDAMQLCQLELGYGLEFYFGK